MSWWEKSEIKGKITTLNLSNVAMDTGRQGFKA